jgi:hypothetical protein
MTHVRYMDIYVWTYILLCNITSSRTLCDPVGAYKDQGNTTRLEFENVVRVESNLLPFFMFLSLTLKEI